VVDLAGELPGVAVVAVGGGGAADVLAALQAAEVVIAPGGGVVVAVFLPGHAALRVVGHAGGDAAFDTLDDVAACIVLVRRPLVVWALVAELPAGRVPLVGF